MEVISEHFEEKNSNENKITENQNSENEQDKNNLSKSDDFLKGAATLRTEGSSKVELKRVETEKRVKRIHELMELIDKANEEIQIYQDELWDLLKTQIKLPNKQKRERKARVYDDENKEEEAEGDHNKRREKKEKEKERDISKKISPFDRFFKPKEVESEENNEIQGKITLERVDSTKKQRARAVSYDDIDKNIKKKKIEHFEVTDIYQIEGIEPEFVRECLEKCDVTGDIRLFRRLFIKNIPKEQQLLRYFGGKNYQVKRNDLWIDDLNGIYIKSVLSKMFEKSYIIVNELDHYKDNIDQFLINQDHITQFDDDKYMEKLMAQITSIVDVKNKN